MKGIKCIKPALIAGEQIHAYATISSTGELNINEDNMIMTVRPLNFTVKGALNVFWEIEDVGYKIDGDDIGGAGITGYYNDENNDNSNSIIKITGENKDDGPHISLPVLLQKNDKGKWEEESIDVDIGLIFNNEKISIGKATFTVSTDYIGHRKLCLPVRNKPKKSSITNIKKKMSFLKKKKNETIRLSSISASNTTTSVNSKLFRLSKSANLDLEIDIVDTLPHLSDKDEYVINELDIQETLTEEQVEQERRSTRFLIDDENTMLVDGEIPKRIMIKNTESTQSTEITFEKKDLMEAKERNTFEKIMVSFASSASQSSDNYEGWRFIPACVHCSL